MLTTDYGHAAHTHELMKLAGRSRSQLAVEHVGGELFGGLEKVIGAHMSGELVPRLRQTRGLGKIVNVSIFFKLVHVTSYFERITITVMKAGIDSYHGPEDDLVAFFATVKYTFSTSIINRSTDLPTVSLKVVDL
ncbi:hypothetical protein F511_05717 [Dorcoceras hygrometricum]|uniref:Uncharacterized protein n=1 Tax=Dorcoceras hygrometricum TaxID=472368 RepID=A0A2Z7BF39_9LAMI|nr:hypothetical protein F511_05717 [Dorcoceras hygrometricum]